VKADAGKSSSSRNAAVGVPGDGDEGESSSSSRPASGLSDFSTKAGIDAYIDANWERLGYKSRPDKVISLTIDDGPGNITNSLLAVLEEYEVTATFFWIGQNVRSNQAQARATFAAGHEIENHSDGTSSGPSKSSIESCSQAIKDITGSNPTMFRAPNVEYINNIEGTCRELGMPLIDVSVWTHDYKEFNASTIEENAVRDASKSGDIINCHEYDRTVQALPNIIKRLRDKGFWFLPLGQMAIYKGITLQAGQKYNYF
jgi:peptidoglycan/xylan/chitin deacetylase (PgdA/CDA1 family)